MNVSSLNKVFGFLILYIFIDFIQLEKHSRSYLKRLSNFPVDLLHILITHECNYHSNLTIFFK